ncbi:tetratricopeptide repeat protein [Streptomyces sp. NPDC053431]|uniref:tetratricopeptide repeat protein n=1 Tax=Streptomyces sp. NPDC053431 TaxID=3365703 RepID=UPI0037CEB758
MEEPLELARLLNLLGVVLRSTGRLKASERRLREAMWAARRSSAGAAGQEAMATIRHNLAGLYLAFGDLRTAERQARAALELREKAAGGNVLALAADRLCLAGVLSAAGQIIPARALAEEALSEYSMRLGENHAEIGFCLHVLAHTHVGEGRRDLAADLYRQAIAVKARALGENHPELAASWLGLALQLNGAARDHALRRAQQVTSASAVIRVGRA